MSTLVSAADGEGFTPPGPADFVFPPIVAGITKPMVMLVLSVVIIVGFYVIALRRQALVPSRLQFAGEMVYGFVRNQIGRDLIGNKDFLPYVPYLVALFSFVLLNNFFGLVPLVQFPTMSIVAFPYVLAIIAWIVYNVAGIRRHGFLRYLKLQSIPPGVPKALLPMVAALEFLSNILVRPVTLSLRLFANMFAGHLLLLLFALGAQHLLTQDQLLLKFVAPLSFAMGILMSFFELLIQFLQAYIITLLTALYIGIALADEH